MDLKILFFLILGLALSSIFLLPVLELIQISQRTIETLGLSSHPFIWPENFISLIAPDFFGNPATRNFWGKGDYLDNTLYAGVTTLIFALTGLRTFFNKIPVRFGLFLLTVSITLSVQNPVSTYLYNLGIWGGSSLTLNRVNFMINFSLAILGAYGLSSIKKQNFQLSLKSVIWVFSTALGALIGLLISKQFLFQSGNSDFIKLWVSYVDVAFRNLVLPIFIIITIFLASLLIKKFPQFKLKIMPIFVFILVVELFRFGWKFNTFSSPDLIYPETPVSRFLQQYPNERVAFEQDVFPANMWVPFKISSIAGYDGIYPLNIAKLLSTANSGDVDSPPQTRWGVLTDFDSKIVDETNTRFLVAVKRDKNGQVSVKGKVDDKIKLSKYKEIFSEKGIVVLENTQSLPRAYLTKEVIKASDKETLKLLQDDNFPIRIRSITDDFEFNKISNESLQSDLTYTPLTNSHVRIKSKSSIDSYLVVLDSFYPGWKALVDGKETKIHRTNYNFRGLVLPKGEHIVDFIYDPDSLKFGAIISGISLLIIFILLVNPKPDSFLQRFE